MESEATEDTQIFTGSSSLGSLLPSVIMLAFALYFVFGAPHLVRWHVKRSERLAAVLAEGNGTSGGPEEV